MPKVQTSLSKTEIIRLSMEIFTKIIAISLILIWAFLILKPFLMLIIWAIILAVAIFPLMKKIEKRFHLKRSLIAVLIVLAAVIPLSVPAYMISKSAYSTGVNITEKIKNGDLYLPPPSEKVANWPLIGDKVYAKWEEISKNDLGDTLQQYHPQIKTAITKAVSMAGSTLSAALLFIISLIIASVFMIYGEKSEDIFKSFMKRLVGTKGEEWARVSTLTVRSVMYGIIGIAVTQAFLALIGLILIDMPLASLWAGGVLFLAIIQLPPLLILGPVIAYVFTYADTTPATIFAIYTIIVSMIDGVLKPFVLGRGVDIPMLVILLGAIGGMIMSGIIGLFVGAVVLALAYETFMAWLKVNDEPSQAEQNGQSS
jgi:predicted PurR-regulated permease PerM